MRTKIKSQSIQSDGWYPVSETWTYASASTINIPTGGVSRFQVGDKLKLNNTTTKYLYIVGVADALLTVTGGTDYTVANAAISAIYISREANPFGFPGFFNYLSTPSGSGGSAGTFAEAIYVSRFSLVGNKMSVLVYKDVTNKGSWTGDIRVPLPTTSPSTPSYSAVSANLNVQWGSVTHFAPFQIIGNQSFGCFDKYGSGYAQWADVTASFRITIDGSYFI